MSRIRRLSQVISEEGRRALASQQAAKIRDAAFSIVDQANLNASTTRKVTKKAAFTVVLRSLQSTRNLPFSLREHMAIKELSQYITLAQSDRSHSLTLSNTDLLPVSHPRSTRNHAMTASALTEARARWVADDPRIVDGYAKTILASALTSEYLSVEHIYYNSILSGLPQGVVPTEIIIAAGSPFSGGNSSAERSLRARLQRRDRDGRFAFMGGGLTALIRKKNGRVYNLVGRPVIDGPNGDDIQMQLPDGKIVNIPASKGLFIKAVINPTSDGYSKDTAKTATNKNIINEEDLVYVDAPRGWKKTGEGAWESTDGDWAISKSKDSKGNDQYAVKDAKSGKTVSAGNDNWEDALDSIAEKKEGKKAVLPSGDKMIQQVNIDPPKDGGNGSGPKTPKPFKFKYPDGAIKIKIDESYDPEGRIDEESPDFTDDPVELGQRFDPRDLVQALEQGVLPENEGDNAIGYGVLRFNGGDEYVPVQAIYNALDEAGEDAPLELARIYDKALGGNDNENALKDNRKGVARLDQSKPDVAESFERTVAMNPDEVPATEAPKFSEAEMDLPPVLSGLSDAEMKQFMETGDHTPYLPENESIDMPEGYNSLDPAPFSSWREVTADTPDSVLPEGFSDNPVFLAQSIDKQSLEAELRRSIEPDSATPGYANISLQDEDGEEFVANIPGEAVRDALQLQGVDTNELIKSIADEGFGGQEEQIIMDPPKDAPEQGDKFTKNENTGYMEYDLGNRYVVAYGKDEDGNWFAEMNRFSRDGGVDSENSFPAESEADARAMAEGLIDRYNDAQEWESSDGIIMDPPKDGGPDIKDVDKALDFLDKHMDEEGTTEDRAIGISEARGHLEDAKKYLQAGDKKSAISSLGSAYDIMDGLESPGEGIFPNGKNSAEAADVVDKLITRLEEADTPKTSGDKSVEEIIMDPPKDGGNPPLDIRVNYTPPSDDKGEEEIIMDPPKDGRNKPPSGDWVQQEPAFKRDKNGNWVEQEPVWKRVKAKKDSPTPPDAPVEEKIKADQDYVEKMKGLYGFEREKALRDYEQQGPHDPLDPAYNDEFKNEFEDYLSEDGSPDGVFNDLLRSNPDFARLFAWHQFDQAGSPIHADFQPSDSDARERFDAEDAKHALIEDKYGNESPTPAVAVGAGLNVLMAPDYFYYEKKEKLDALKDALKAFQNPDMREDLKNNPEELAAVESVTKSIEAEIAKLEGGDAPELNKANAPKEISDDELLDRRLAGESLDAVAKDLGITREEVRRREANAYRKRMAENPELPPTPEGLDAPENKELIAKFNRQYVKEFLDQEEALADKYEAEEDMPRGDAQAVAEADMKRMYGKTAGEALAELPREEAMKVLEEREKEIRPDVSEPSAQAEAVAAIDVNSPNLQEEIQSAIDKGQKIAFSYNGKNRIVTPQSIWTNPKNGNVNLRAIEDGPDGGIKVFTLDKMEMAEGVVPTPPPVTKPKELSEADIAVIKNNEYVEANAGTLQPTEAKNLQVGDFMWNAFFERYEEILAMEPADMGRIKFKVFNVYNNQEEDRYFEMDSPLRNVRRPGIEDEAEPIEPAKAAPRGGKRGLIKRAPLSDQVRAKEGRPIAKQKEEEGLFKDKNGVPIKPGDVVIHPKHPEWGRGVVKNRIGAQVKEGKKAGGQVRGQKVQPNKLVVQFEGDNPDWVLNNAGRELKAGNLELFDGNYDDLVLDPRFRGGAMVPNAPANPDRPVPPARPDVAPEKLDETAVPAKPDPEQGRLFDTPEGKPPAPAGPGMAKAVYKAEVEDEKGNKFKISVVKIDDVYEAAVFNEKGDLNAVIAKNISLAEVQGVVGRFIGDVAESRDGDKVIRLYGGIPEPVKQPVLSGEAVDVPPLPEVKAINLKEAKARAAALAEALRDKELPGDARKNITAEEQEKMKLFIRAYLSTAGAPDRRKDEKFNDDLRVARRYAMALGWFDEAREIAAIQKRVDKLPLRPMDDEFNGNIEKMQELQALVAGLELDLARPLGSEGRKKVNALMEDIDQIVMNPDLHNPNFRNGILRGRRNIDGIMKDLEAAKVYLKSRNRDTAQVEEVTEKAKEFKKYFDNFGEMPKLPERDMGDADDKKKALAKVADQIKGMKLEDLRNGFGDWKFEKELSSGINKVFLFRNPLTGERVVIKHDDDYLVKGMGDVKYYGNGARAEDMVADLYRDLGFANPAFVAANPGDIDPDIGGIGVMEYAGDGFFGLANIEVHNDAGIRDIGQVAPEHRAELLDFLVANAIIGNTDRHGGNFMWGLDPVTGEARLVPIDNGLAVFNGGFNAAEENIDNPLFLNPLKVLEGKAKNQRNHNQVGKFGRQWVEDLRKTTGSDDAAISQVVEFATRMRKRAEALKFVDPRANAYLMARADYIINDPQGFLDTVKGMYRQRRYD